MQRDFQAGIFLPGADANARENAREYEGFSHGRAYESWPFRIAFTVFDILNANASGLGCPFKPSFRCDSYLGGPIAWLFPGIPS
jgi:hypothetical protein